MVLREKNIRDLDAKVFISFECEYSSMDSRVRIAAVSYARWRSNFDIFRGRSSCMGTSAPQRVPVEVYPCFCQEFRVVGVTLWVKREVKYSVCSMILVTEPFILSRHLDVTRLLSITWCFHASISNRDHSVFCSMHHVIFPQA